MRVWTVCILIVIGFTAHLAAVDADEAVYVIGTEKGLSINAAGSLFAGSSIIAFVPHDEAQSTLEIPYGLITTLEYGQRTRPHYEWAAISMWALLAKKRSHFLTVVFTGTDGTEKTMVFELGKAVARPILRRLRATTRVQFQDRESELFLDSRPAPPARATAPPIKP